MKKFFYEYKALRSRTEIKSTTYYERARQRNPSYGREYMKIMEPSLEEEVSSADTSLNTGTMRTKKYKNHLGEFHTRRDASVTPEKNTPNRDTVTEEYNQDLGQFNIRRSPEKNGGRSANPVSCTSCIAGHNESLPYEKTPPQKRNRKSRLTRGKQISESEDQVDGLTPKVVLPHTPLHRVTVPHILVTEDSSSSSGDDTSRHKLEVPSLSSIITGSFSQEKCESMQEYKDVCESDSESPLFVMTRSEVEVTTSTDESWKFGTWGSLLFQMKKKDEAEILLLRKCIHPNVIPLMGLFADVNSQEYVITEKCVGSLYTILHDQKNRPLIKTASRYVSEITSALLFIQLRGYMHSKINSSTIMITPYDIAKLSDLSPCVPLKKSQTVFPKVYSPEPQYINIKGASCNDAFEDCQPLISQDSSEEYILNNCVKQPHTLYENCKKYQWLAPECFSPDVDGFVNVCSKTDVYSLSLVLWETLNAMIPWGTLSYSQLNERYTILKAGINLPNNGTYPGALLSLLQEGLQLNRSNRTDINTFYKKLQNVMESLSDDENKIKEIRLSERQFKGEENLLNSSHLLQYMWHLEKINKENKFEPLIDFSSVATSPVDKTTESLYRSDSTEDCGIVNPEYYDVTASTAIPSGRFTSMLEKVPEHSPEPLRSDLRDEGSSNTSAYKFKIHKNCTLPKTPIARKNMLLKYAWLSGCKTPITSTDNLNSVSGDNTRLNCEHDLSYPAKDCGKDITSDEKFGWLSLPKVNTNKCAVKKSPAELEEISIVKHLISLYEQNIQKQIIQCSQMQKDKRQNNHKCETRPTPKLHAMHDSETQTQITYTPSANTAGQSEKFTGI